MAAPTEVSRFWTTGGAGDGASTYTRDQLAEVFRNAFLSDPTTMGPFTGLAVSGAASPMTLAVGAACVYGYLYFCTVAGDLAKATPVVGTTGFRVVLRVDWTAQTVRAVVVSSADGVAAIPAVTQVAGTTWDISLATGTITTGGVIALTDARTFARFNTLVSTAMLQLLSVTTAVINDLAVTSGKLAALSVIAGKIADGAVDTTARLANNIVTFAKMVQSAAAGLSVVGRATNSAGDFAEIVAGTDGHVLRRSGNALAFGQIVAAGITDETITPAKLQNRPAKFMAPVLGGHNITDNVNLKLNTANGEGIGIPDAKVVNVQGAFPVPADFVSGMTVKAIVLCPSGGTLRSGLAAVYGAVGQALGTHNAVQGEMSVALGATILTAANSVTLTDAALGDIVNVKWERDGLDANDTLSDEVSFIGFEVEYTRDH